MLFSDCSITYSIILLYSKNLSYLRTGSFFIPGQGKRNTSLECHSKHSFLPFLPGFVFITNLPYFNILSWTVSYPQIPGPEWSASYLLLWDLLNFTSKCPLNDILRQAMFTKMSYSQIIPYITYGLSYQGGSSDCKQHMPCLLQTWV